MRRLSDLRKRLDRNPWRGRNIFLKRVAFFEDLYILVNFFFSYFFSFHRRQNIQRSGAKETVSLSKQKVLLLLLKGSFRAQITNYLLAECDRMMNPDEWNEPWLFTAILFRFNPQSQHLLLPGIQLCLTWDAPASNHFLWALWLCSWQTGFP